MKNKIIWLTGQSGAGKTTFAKMIGSMIDCIILDGDEMRESISLGAGFSKKDRKEHNLRVARLAKVLSKQTNVVVAVIAPMEKVRREISDICDPIWIYVRRTLPTRKGHFYEEPKRPHYCIDGDEDLKKNTILMKKIIAGIFNF
ncbi:MAG: adenylyl-sulfate kinase [bacterium]|nr:adenylyl-sulfate kinase [bacterium]